jgi:hypothetical protein
VAAAIEYHRHVLCPACNGRVDLQATVCSSCDFDIAARDPTQMVVRARRDVKIAIGLLVLGLAGAALTVLLFGFARLPAGASIGTGMLVPPVTTIFGLSLGGKLLRSALRRLAVARTIERVPSARVVTRKRP